MNLPTKILVVVDDELVDAPVLVAAVRKVSADDDGDLALLQLLHGDLESVRSMYKH